jgi:hypothetical protein
MRRAPIGDANRDGLPSRSGEKIFEYLAKDKWKRIAKI